MSAPPTKWQDEKLFASQGNLVVQDGVTNLFLQDGTSPIAL